MSHVTNVILKTRVLNEGEVINPINDYLKENGMGFFTQVNNEGGRKFLEIDIYTAAFNYLDIEEFTRHCESVFLKHKGCQLFIQGQYDDLLTEVLRS